MFYAASLSKQVIGVLVSMCVERGELSADESIREFVPELPAWTEAITLRHLLHHTSGLLFEATPPGAERTAEAVVGAIGRGDRAPFAPSERFQYSNDGFVLLGVALEHACGAPLDVVARELIFGPLGMSASSLATAPRVEGAGEAPPPRTLGDGGWWTSIDDAVTWLQALNTRRLGNSVTARTVAPTVLRTGEQVEYGWGVGLRTVAGLSAFSHGGSWERWHSKAIRVPAAGLAVVVATRASDPELAIALADAAVARAIDKAHLRSPDDEDERRA